MGIDNTYGTLGLRPGVCTSTSRPASPYEGMVIYETDTNRSLVWDNSAWVMLNQSEIGLWRVASGSITNATQARIQGCFSSTYLNYVVNITASDGTANTEITLQLMSGNTEATTNYSYIANGIFTGGTASNDWGTSSSQFPVTFIPGTKHAATSCFIGQPNQARFTSYSCDWWYDDGGSIIGRHVIGRHKTATAYDGLRIFCGSAFTGTYEIYGYRNS